VSLLSRSVRLRAGAAHADKFQSGKGGEHHHLVGAEAGSTHVVTVRGLVHRTRPTGPLGPTGSACPVPQRPPRRAGKHDLPRRQA
jgi:hypothetical protein